MLRSVAAVVFAAGAIVAAPIAATAMIMTAPASASVETVTAGWPEAAVIAWGGAGATGVAVMVGFGLAVGRRSRSAQSGFVTVLNPADEAQASQFSIRRLA
jgi:hypothetical protein